jgi:CBS domain containing-hemolysin-like protein
MGFPLGEILFLVFLTILEAFFVMAEIALVSVRRTRIDQLVEEGSSGARRVRRLIDDPGRFLAVAQLGLTFIGFFASAFAAVSLVEGLRSLLVGFGVDPGAAETVALVVVTIILALFTIVFAELIPKAIALASPERFALVLAGPIDLLARLLGPIVYLLNGVTRWVARSIGVSAASTRSWSRASRSPRSPTMRGSSRRSTSWSRSGTRGSRSSTSRSTRSSASSTPRTCCRTSSPMPARGRRCGSCCGRPCSSPSR